MAKLLKSALQWTAFAFLVVILLFIGLVLGIWQEIEDRKKPKRQMSRDNLKDE